MIEDAMLFGLGFCVATLVALVCLPAVWARALRLTRRRLEMLVPLSEAEIVAERDGLRAEAAVAQRRLEQRLEKAEQGAADVSAALGRRTAALVTTEQGRDTAEADRTRLSAELAQTAESLVTAEAKGGALQLEVSDMELRLRKGADERQRIEQQSAELELHLQEDRGALAALATKVAGLEARLEDTTKERDRLRTEAGVIAEERDALIKERDAARNEVLFGHQQRAILQEQLRDEVGLTADRSVRMTAKSEALAKAERRIMEQQAEIKASAAALAHLKQRFEALQARLIERVTAPPVDASMSPDELMELRKAIINVADDALLLLHNPAQPEKFTPKRAEGPSDPPKGRSRRGARASR